MKWDEDSAYVRGLQRHDGKAVDIDRNPVEVLAQIAADKVRDTLAGLVFSRERHPGDHLLVHLKTLFDRDERVLVIFWLESFQLDPPLASTLTG